MMDAHMTPFLRYLTMFALCGGSTLAIAGDAKPKILPYGIIVVNAVNNNGTPQPSQDAPIGAVPGSRIGDELAGSGSYGDTGYFRTGIADQDLVNGTWEQAHEARWMAELHIERIETLLEPGEFASSSFVARAYIFEGIAHRALGENYCQVVYSEPDASEYGSLQPRTVAFDKAITAFTNAMSYGSEFQTAAHAGLASAYAALGNWTQAVAEARQVPDDFEFLTFYDSNDDSNQNYVETHQRPEMSAFNSYAGTFDPPDPRAPFTKCEVTGSCAHDTGADGVTVHWRQEKFDDQGSDIVSLSGKEARLIEAEAALRDGNLGEFTTQINKVRALFGIPGIMAPATAGALEYPNAFDDGWSILDGERQLTLWLEGRRLWDLHRWDHPFLNGGTVVWDGEPRRDSCLPVPDGECSVNPNFTCKEAAAGTNSG